MDGSPITIRLISPTDQTWTAHHSRQQPQDRLPGIAARKGDWFRITCHNSHRVSSSTLTNKALYCNVHIFGLLKGVLLRQSPHETIYSAQWNKLNTEIMNWFQTKT